MSATLDSVRANGFRAVELDPVAAEQPRDGVAQRALESQLWSLAEDVGRLRRTGAPSHVCDHASARLDIALNVACPTAADLIKSGLDPDAAFDVVEARGKRLRRLTGEPW